MSDQDIISLSEFGLTYLQARVYVALLKLGKARASAIGTRVGIVRPEVYRVLRELSAKGLIEKNLGSTASYCAIPPARALSTLTKRLRDRLDSLDKKRNELAQSLFSVKAEENSPGERFGLIAGGENAVAKVIEMMREAREDYSAIITKHGLRRAVDNGLASSVLSAKRRKLKVRILSEIDSVNGKIADYLARHVDLRTSQDLMFYMDIVDCRQMIFGPAFPALDEELDERQFDLWTNSGKFVRGMYTLFERLWADSSSYRPSRRRL
jgi:sugar-specific transcriptional regulator TrmB